MVLGQIVQATILNLEIVGGAAGYPVATFIRLPTIAAFAIVIVLVVAALFATRFGIAIRALHDDEVAADLMGVHVRAIQVAAFTVGSIIVGIGGGLYAHYFSFIEAQNFNVALSITVVLYVLRSAAPSRCSVHWLVLRSSLCCLNCYAAARVGATWSSPPH